MATPTIAGGGQLTDIAAPSASNIIAVGTGGNGGTSIRPALERLVVDA